MKLDRPRKPETGSHHPFPRENWIQTSNEVKRSELGGNQGKYSQGNEWTGDSAPEKVFFSSGEIRTEHFQISS